jgi:4-hydroxy-tetrahydrodipicolinate synthase
MTPGTLPPAPFGRVLTAMVTAFHDDGSVDLEGTARVAEHLAEHGHDGVVVSGTTGEAPTTSTEEDGQILRAVVEAVGDRLSVVAGVGTNNTAHSIELAEQAEKVGADGLLLVTPYYNKPTQEGVVAHFEAVANASGLPVMLYDIPGRTGLAITEETLARAAAHDRIVAVKDAVGDLYRGVRVMQATGLSYYSGDDALNLGWLTHGGCGVVSVVGHVAGDQHAALVRAVDAGDLSTALDIYRGLVPVIDAVMTRAPGALMAKAAMQLLGVLPNRNVRLPLLPATDDLVELLRGELTTAGLLHEPPEK